jgi:septum formation protein
MSRGGLVLASGSPRRRELLAEAGFDFEVVISPAEELHDAGVPLAELCERNAEAKAAAVAAQRAEAVVLGADTLVWIDGEPLGKPADPGQARAMLRRLSGRGHTVCTGVCVIGGGRRACFHELTEVLFRALDEAAIGRYFERVNPLDKAGAYAVQEHGEMVVAEVRGDYSNVVGLPLDRVIGVLGGFGVRPAGV